MADTDTKIMQDSSSSDTPIHTHNADTVKTTGALDIQDDTTTNATSCMMNASVNNTTSSITTAHDIGTGEDKMDLDQDDEPEPKLDSSSRTSSPVMPSTEEELLTDETLPEYDGEEQLPLLLPNATNPKTYVYAITSSQQTQMISDLYMHNGTLSNASPSTAYQHGHNKPQNDSLVSGAPYSQHKAFGPSKFMTPPSNKKVPPPPPPQPQPELPAATTGTLNLASTPIRRLAKIRPYANQHLPLSVADIKDAIPKDASAIFHVMDRRVNMDYIEAITPHDQDINIPIYNLLRAWVQDDPYRQIPSCSFPSSCPVVGDVSSTTTTTSRGGSFFATEEQEYEDNNDNNNNNNADDSINDNKRARVEEEKEQKQDDEQDIRETKKSKAVNPTVDLAAVLNNSSSASPSMEILKQELVTHAQEVRKRKNERYRKQLRRTLHGLTRKGIVLG